jgi:hypothetical protein
MTKIGTNRRSENINRTMSRLNKTSNTAMTQTSVTLSANAYKILLQCDITYSHRLTAFLAPVCY